MTSAYLWYVLLESATGQSYKGTTADAVLLPPDADIDDFLKVVHRKNSSILSSIVASDLVIFKNKAAFDSRKNAEDPDKKPLKFSRNLDGLGAQEEEALVVVVPPPSQPQYQRITQTPSFPPCRLQFFNSMPNITERHGCISFGQEIIPSTSLSSLYIRECYRTIASSILRGHGIHRAVINGSPGIGKSLFLVYLLWRLVTKGKRVLFLYGSFTIYYDGNGGVFRLASSRLPLNNDYSFWNDTLWCLFDPKFKTVSDFVHLPVELSTFIISTSPRRGVVSDFMKPPVPQVFYMPTWTEAELEAIAPLFPKAIHEWRDRFAILGGIPRYVLEVTTKNPIEILKAACKNCSLENFVDESMVVHSLVHVTSIPPFEEPTVYYASSTALNVIARRKVIEVRREMKHLLPSCEENPLAAALYGCIFEQYAIELLEIGGTFACRQLVGDNTEIQSIDTTLDIPRSKKVVVDKVLPDQTIHQLHLSKTKNDVAIDAWIPGIGAFQMTIGKKNDIKDGARDDLAMLGECNRLYWLLPPLDYHSFTKKSPHDIEQYAIRIPYPESKDLYIAC